MPCIIQNLKTFRIIFTLGRMKSRPARRSTSSRFSMKSPKSSASNFTCDIVRQIRFPDWQSTEGGKREVRKDRAITQGAALGK